MILLKKNKELARVLLLSQAASFLLFLNLWMIQFRFSGLINPIHLLEDKYLPWLCFVFSWWIIQSWAIMTANRGMFWLSFALAIGQALLNFNITYSKQYYGLAFFEVMVLAYQFFLLLNWRQALDRSYFQSGLKWYQGLPVFLPKIIAEIKNGNEDASVRARVSSLDRYGCVIYAEDIIEKVDNMKLRIDGKELSLSTELISKSARGGGYGIQFRMQGRDQEKDLLEFIDQARSMGYVE